MSWLVWIVAVVVCFPIAVIGLCGFVAVMADYSQDTRGTE